MFQRALEPFCWKIWVTFDLKWYEKDGTFCPRKYVMRESWRKRHLNVFPLGPIHLYAAAFIHIVSPCYKEMYLRYTAAMLNCMFDIGFYTFLKRGQWWFFSSLKWVFCFTEGVLYRKLCLTTSFLLYWRYWLYFNLQKFILYASHMQCCIV